MSKFITVIECSRCHAELYRKTEGDMFNDNGTCGIVKNIYEVNESMCSHCKNKEAEHD